MPPPTSTTHTFSSTTHTFSSTSIFRPPPQTPLRRFIRAPLPILAEWLYHHQPLKSPPYQQPQPPTTSPIRIVCVSDTHTSTPSLPPGDILLHAGDLTNTGSFAELQFQLTWLSSLPHAHKIVIAGNHDLLLDPTFSNRTFVVGEGKTRDDLQWGSVMYLEHNSATVEVRGRKVKIFGSPYTQRYGNWAFQYGAGSGGKVWRGEIPRDADVVVVHGPVLGHLDVAPPSYRHAGCGDLGDEVREVRPELFVCGHVHEGRGREVVWWNGVERMYSRALGMNGRAGIGAWVDLVIGILTWVWLWVEWMFGKGGRTQKTLMLNASTVGHWGVADGMVVEI